MILHFFTPNNPPQAIFLKTSRGPFNCSLFYINARQNFDPNSHSKQPALIFKT